MDPRDSAHSQDLLDLSTHSNDRSYFSQNPSHSQRNSASQYQFMQDDSGLRNPNKFPSGPSFMPGQNPNANGGLDQYLNFESTPKRLDQIQMPANRPFDKDRELQSSLMPQNNQNIPFQNQPFAQTNDMKNMMPSSAGVQEFLMNNMNNLNLLQQFNQFLQFMNPQGRSMPPFPNASYSDTQRNFGTQNIPFNTNPQSYQTAAQQDSVDEGAALPSNSELINGNFHSTDKRTSRPLKDRPSNKDFDSELKVNKSGESQFQTDEFENIEKNLDNFYVKTNIPVGESTERDKRPITLNQKETINKPEQHEANPFDDIKIKGVNSKRFEDLLEEQLRQNPDAIKKGTGSKTAVPKKEFLKRGSGMNVTNKSHKDKGDLHSNFNEEKENLGYNNESNFLSNDRKLRGDGERNTNNPLTVRHLNENTVLQDQNLFSDRPGKKNQNENMFGKYSIFGEKADQKPNKFGTLGNKQEKIKKNIENESAPPHKQYGQKRLAKEEFEEKAYNSDSDGQNIQFDDPEEWRSPDKKEYNLEKYTQEAPVTFGNQEDDRSRSESPVYEFDDEFEADNNSKKFNKKNYETKQKEEPSKGKFFWERENEAISPKPSEPQERKKTKPIEQEKKQSYKDPRLLALDKEIEKFRAENERVEAERKEWKETFENLERQKEEWDHHKETERKEVDDWKQEESKKIKKERKIVAESHQNIYKNVAGRKEREEIENLKKQLEELKEQMDTKDRRSKTNLERLKKRLDDENQKTVELKQELKYYEEMRIKGNDPRNPKSASQNNKTNLQPVRERQDQAIKKDVPRASQKKIREEAESEEEEDIIHEEDNEEEDSGDERNQRYRISNKKRHGHAQSELKYEDIIKDPRKPNDRGHIKDHRKTSEKTSRTPSKISEDRRVAQTVERREVSKAHSSKPNQYEDEEYEDYPDTGRTLREMERKSFSQDAYLFNTNSYYQKYMGPRNRANRVLKEVMFDDGKIQIQRIYEDGRREDVFFNGVRRLVWLIIFLFGFVKLAQTFPDGYNIIYFINKDIRQTLPDSTVIYYYAEAQTTQTKLPNGECVYRFNKDDNDQIEFHYTDDSKDIYFPDGSRKIVFPNQEEETSFPDGTVTKVNANKVKFTYYPDRTKEVLYPDGLKVRTYLDGRTKKFFPDGSVEIS